MINSNIKLSGFEWKQLSQTGFGSTYVFYQPPKSSGPEDEFKANLDYSGKSFFLFFFSFFIL